jgi:ribonuclease HII
MPDFSIEKSLIKQGYKRICGIDEVGRGSWAGPVVVCASIHQNKLVIKDINDSKKLSSEKRGLISQTLIRGNTEFAIGKASSEEIDKYGIIKSLKLASSRALKKLKTKPDAIILDGNINYIKKDYLVFTHKKADEKSMTVAAASILAKVYRDNLMTYIHNKDNPNYEFHNNKGYGTRIHKEKIDKHGLSKYHRKTYKIENSWATNLAK